MKALKEQVTDIKFKKASQSARTQRKSRECQVKSKESQVYTDVTVTGDSINSLKYWYPQVCFQCALSTLFINPFMFSFKNKAFLLLLSCKVRFCTVVSSFTSIVKQPIRILNLTHVWRFSRCRWCSLPLRQNKVLWNGAWGRICQRRSQK